jgi:hypothetical protein
LPRAAWRGSGRRMTVCWALSSLPGWPTLSSFTTAGLGPAHAHGEARNKVINCGWKWMGASRLERAEPHGSSPGWQLYLTAQWTFCWGPAWGWKARHRAANVRPKVNGGHATGACWAPRAMHWDRRLNRTLLPPLWPTRMPSRQLACQNHTSYGVAVLNCM